MECLVMNVLLVGCGSIGKRHLKNLIDVSQVKKIFVCSKVKDCLSELKETNKVVRVESLKDIQADFTIIANETHQHIDTALMLAKKGIHLFIEKPLSHCRSHKLNALKAIMREKKINIGVGYNLRFLGAIKLIKTILSKGILGDIYFVKIEAGQYLPSWRSGCDYRVSYSSSQRRGGGVALDLSHEIDYMRYFFGDPLSFKVVRAKVSDLKIDSDDIFEGIYMYDRFLCNVHLDYLQKNKKRVIRIEASKGFVVCDLISKKITIEIRGKKKIIVDQKLFDFDKTYFEEIINFMRSMKRGHKPEVTFEDGLKVLELIEANHV
jgi:predicted dehydrogenase